MRKRAVTGNIIYSIITQLAGIIAPLIISPYISRVFNANLIGDYGYTLANSSYFVLVESLGLTLYGMLKVAQMRDNREKLSFFFWEVFWLKALLMILSLAVYSYVFVINGEERLKKLYLVMALNIVANGIDVTWLLNGLEEFKTVAIRTVMVRTANILLVLLLVKTEKDIDIYAWIMQGSIFVSYLAVLPIAVRKVQWVNPLRLHPLSHVLPSFVYFVPGLVNTIFSSADKSVLGAFSQNSYEVGVYEQANKICQLCMGMISALSNALLPRATYLYANDNKKEATGFVYKSIRIVIMISLPISFGIASISDQFIPAFFGQGYDKSAYLLKILCINVLSVAISNFIAQQCLIARGKQKEYNISVSISAGLNLILNILFVNKYMSVGVSAASVVSGVLILVFIVYFSREILPYKLLTKISWKYVLSSIIMLGSVAFIKPSQNLWITIAIKVGVGAIVYFVCLYLLRDEMCIRNKR